MTKAREKGNNFGKVYKKGQPAKNGLSFVTIVTLGVFALHTLGDGSDDPISKGNGITQNRPLYSLYILVLLLMVTQGVWVWSGDGTRMSTKNPFIFLERDKV